MEKKNGVQQLLLLLVHQAKFFLLWLFGKEILVCFNEIPIKKEIKNIFKFFNFYNLILDTNLSLELEKKWKNKIFFAQNEKAWMNTKLFQQYLSQIFSNSENRLVICDTASAHGYIRSEGFFNLFIF